MALQLNDNVKVKFSTLSGTVKGASVDQTTLNVEYLVAYDDNEGIAQQRYFTEDQLELA